MTRFTVVSPAGYTGPALRLAADIATTVAITASSAKKSVMTGRVGWTVGNSASEDKQRIVDLDVLRRTKKQLSRVHRTPFQFT